MANENFKQLKYNKARLAIMGLIAQEGLQVGDRIPSTRNLVKMLPYGGITICHALADMEVEGLIERRPGSGTYLARELKDNRFSSNILLIFVAKRGENAPGPGADPLRRYLAARGIGLNLISVYEFGLDIVEAAKNSFAILLSGWLTETFLAQMRTIRLPMMAIGNYKESGGIPSVSLDLASGTYRATKTLIEEGQKKIVLFRGLSEEYYPSVAYESGYAKAMKEAGLPCNIQQNPALLESGETMDRFMESGEAPDAILMEPGYLYDLVSWCWRNSYPHHPALVLLVSPPDYRKYRQCKELRCVVYPDAGLEAVKSLLDHVVNDAELKSKVLSPYIPGVDDQEEYFVRHH